MSDVCGDAEGKRLRGSPSFLWAGDKVGNAFIRFPLLFRHFPKCLRYSVAEKVSNTLLAFSKELLIPFRYCSNGL
jgi:hypothetical protein